MDDDLGDQTQAIPLAGDSQPTAPSAGPVAAAGWVLADRYRVLDRIGSGGMADVFRAHDEQLDRDVAVKVFRTPVDEPGNASAAERREIELRALAQLSHPNLIALYDANVADAHPAFLVTELVVGPNLAARLTEGPLPEELVRTIGAQIADALAYVHARGMVHRDVKPANILLGTDGPDPETATIRARLSDFGIVRVIEQTRMTAAEFTLGTAFYLAPEQARGGDVTAAADVYALGLVLIEMLTGERSFDGPMHEAMAARLDHAPAIPPGLPQPWPGLLAAMTLADPAARPTAAEVAQSLQSSLPPSFSPAPVAALVPAFVPGPSADAHYPVPAEPEPRRHRGAALAAVALACAAVIAGGIILILQPSGHPSTPAVGGTTGPTSSGSSASTAPSAKSSRNDADAPVTAGRSAPSESTSASRSTAHSSASTTASRTHTAASSTAASRAPSSTATRTSAAPTHTTSAPHPSTSATSKPATSTSAATTPAAPPQSVAPASGGVVDSASP